MKIEEIIVTTCITCCLEYPVEKRIVELKRKTQEPIYCPNGHAGIFVRKDTISNRPIEEIEEIEQENLKLIHKVEMLEAKLETLEHAKQT